MNAPRIDLDTRTKFETEFEIRLNATEKRGGKSENTTQKIIQMKVNANLDKGLVVAHALDKQTGINATALVDAKEKMVYAITANVCHKMQLPADAVRTNLSEAETHQFTQLMENLTYLGEYELDQVACHAYELRLSADQFPTRSPSERGDRPNYIPDIVTATVYYPKDAKHWSKTETTSIPKRFEVRLLDTQANKEFAKITLDVKSFNPNPKDPEKIDTSKCIDAKSMMG